MSASDTFHVTVGRGTSSSNGSVMYEISAAVYTAIALMCQTFLCHFNRDPVNVYTAPPVERRQTTAQQLQIHDAELAV